MKYRAALAVLGLLFLSMPAQAASSFNEIKRVLRDEINPNRDLAEKVIVDQYANGNLPHYTISKEPVHKFWNAAMRTLSATDDYHTPFTKVVHANGICLTGQWQITESSPYSGYFAQGQKGLFVGRASTTDSETERGGHRGFGLAGKIYPTLDPDENLEPANFFVVDTLLGEDTDHFVDTAMTNEPDIGLGSNFWRVAAVFLLKTIGDNFKDADERVTPKMAGNPMFRPLYPVSELGTHAGEKIQTPHWMRITTDTSINKAIDEVDFRRELDLQLHPRNGGLRLLIAVSNTTKDRTASKGWRQIGEIVLTGSYLSSGCDRQLHFPHPRQR